MIIKRRKYQSEKNDKTERLYIYYMSFITPWHSAGLSWTTATHIRHIHTCTCFVFQRRIPFLVYFRFLNCFGTPRNLSFSFRMASSSLDPDTTYSSIFKCWNEKFEIFPSLSFMSQNRVFGLSQTPYHSERQTPFFTREYVMSALPSPLMIKYLKWLSLDCISPRERSPHKSAHIH